MRLPQPEHIEHIVQTAALSGQKAGRPQTALRIGLAAGGLVADFNTLTGARKKHRVIAHNIAAAHGGKADGGGIALTGVAVALVNRTVLEIAAQRLGDDFPIFSAVPEGASTLCR